MLSGNFDFSLLKNLFEKIFFQNSKKKRKRKKKKKICLCLNTKYENLKLS